MIHSLATYQLDHDTYTFPISFHRHIHTNKSSTYKEIVKYLHYVWKNRDWDNQNEPGRFNVKHWLTLLLLLLLLLVLLLLLLLVGLRDLLCNAFLSRRKVVAIGTKSRLPCLVFVRIWLAAGGVVGVDRLLGWRITTRWLVDEGGWRSLSCRVRYVSYRLGEGKKTSLCTGTFRQRGKGFKIGINIVDSIMNAHNHTLD